MVPASRTYKEIMARDYRNRGYLLVTMYLVNQSAQAGATTSGDYLYYSMPNTIFDNDYISDIDYATMEQDYWRANGKFYFAPPMAGTDILDQNLISRDLLGTATITLSTPHDIRGLTIDFGKYYPTELEVQCGTEIYHYENNNSIFIMKDTLFGATSIVIRPISMLGGQKRLRIRNFMFGFTVRFNNDNVESMLYSNFAHGISEELPALELDITAFDYDEIYNVDDPKSPINFFEPGQEVDVQIGLEYDDEETIEWLNIATLYMEEWTEAKYNMTFKAVDKFVFMNGLYSAGNRIYTRTLHDEAVSILQDAGIVHYWLDDCLKDITITNPISEMPHSSALQLIANAGRCTLSQDADGQLVLRANFVTVLDPDSIVVTSTGGTAYSNAHSVLEELDGLYAHIFKDIWSADGSMYFVPPSAPYMKAGYISSSVADESGDFSTTPSITLDLQGGYIFQSIIVTLENEGAPIVTVNTWLNSEPVESIEFYDLHRGPNPLSHPFERFDTIQLVFNKGISYNRIYVSRIAFGNLNDYTFRQFDMMEFLESTKEQRVANIRVRVFTFENDEQDKPVQVDDDVWVTINTDYQGETVSYENTLISTQEHAQLVAEWIENYYKNNIHYNIDFRGEPTLEAADIVFMENDLGDKIQVQIQDTTLKFDGSFSGSVEARRAINKVDL